MILDKIQTLIDLKRAGRKLPKEIPDKLTFTDPADQHLYDAFCQTYINMAVGEKAQQGRRNGGATRDFLRLAMNKDNEVFTVKNGTLIVKTRRIYVRGHRLGEYLTILPSSGWQLYEVHNLTNPVFKVKAYGGSRVRYEHPHIQGGTHQFCLGQNNEFSLLNLAGQWVDAQLFLFRALHSVKQGNTWDQLSELDWPEEKEGEV